MNTEEQIEETQEAEVSAPEETQAPEEATTEETSSTQQVGVTEDAGSDEAVEIAEQKEPGGSDKELFPSFFMKEDEEFTVELDILYDPEDGKIIRATRKGILNMNAYNLLKSTSEWFRFTLPDYDEITRYRQQSSVYSSTAGTFVYDNIQVRHFLIIHHLKDWSLRDGNGKKVELKFTRNGSLEEDFAMQVVYRVPPAIMDTVMTIFERDGLVS